jgi:hypothetical protein
MTGDVTLNKKNTKSHLKINQAKFTLCKREEEGYIKKNLFSSFPSIKAINNFQIVINYCIFNKQLKTMKRKIYTLFSLIVFVLSLNSQTSITSSSTLICVGESATLTANHDFLHNWFSWSNGATTNSIVVSPTTTTSYAVTCYDVDLNSISASFTQSVSLCLGFKKTDSDDLLQIFPNPFTDKITLNGLRQQALVEIHNALGSMIYKGNTDEQKIEIDLSNYSPGIYFIKIKTSDEEIIRKIIKK